MLSNKSILLITLLIAASVLSAWSINDEYFGNRYGAFDARSYAMGSAGVYNDTGAFGIADNPANLTLLRKTLGFAVNSYISRNQDDRSIPLYNSFDNYVDDAVYASNINNYDNFAGAAFGAYNFNGIRCGLGGYYKPRLSFDSDYSEEIRNNGNTDNDGYPNKLAQNVIEGEGTLNQTGFTASVGYSLGDYTDLNFGVDFAMLNGDITRNKTIRWTDWAVNTVHAVGADYNLPELTETSDYELSGSQIKIGGAVQLNTHFGVAATYTPKTTLDKEGSYYYKRDAYRNTAMDSINVALKEDYIMPSEIRIGFVYLPRNVMRTKFNLDVEFVKFSDVTKVNGDSVGVFEDVVNFYAGVEHHIVNRIPFRLGFQAVSSWFFTSEIPYDVEGDPIVDSEGNPITVYHAKKLITPMITAGSSILIAKNWTVDLGFGYSWREYEAIDMFTDAYYNDKIYTGASTYALWPNSHIQLQNRGWENPDKVRENNITLNAGLTFNW